MLKLVAGISRFNLFLPIKYPSKCQNPKIGQDCQVKKGQEVFKRRYLRGENSQVDINGGDADVLQPAY